MATSLADSPPVLPDGHVPPEGSNGTPAGPPAAPPPVAAAGRRCARCGSEMAAGQDWCLQCGAGAPGSLGTPSWRSAAMVLGVVAALALGAAAAAVAALSKGAAKAPVVTTTVAQAPAPTATTPTTPGTTPTTPGALGTTPKVKSTLPLGTVKPPKIPLTAATPKASEKATTTTPSSETKTTTTPTTTTPSSGSSTTGEKTSEESQQAAILLDTDAATTYDPYGYPASGFGDPSLAIDGDPSTAWTAQVNPATAPKMAQGLLIDLKAKQNVAVLELITSTPGMTVQVYGANGHTAPASITDPAWVPLSAPTVAKKKHLRLALRDSSKEFTFITLWISKAPKSSVGTAEAPGHVDVNELELFPPKS
ncbi:MAG: hypothetical protein ACLQBY_16590 [Solirubrobacteraceae bacterium]